MRVRYATLVFVMVIFFGEAALANKSTWPRDRWPEKAAWVVDQRGQLFSLQYLDGKLTFTQEVPNSCLAVLSSAPPNEYPSPYGLIKVTERSLLFQGVGDTQWTSTKLSLGNDEQIVSAWLDSKATIFLASRLTNTEEIVLKIHSRSGTVFHPQFNMGAALQSVIPMIQGVTLFLENGKLARFDMQVRGGGKIRVNGSLPIGFQENLLKLVVASYFPNSEKGFRHLALVAYTGTPRETWWISELDPTRMSLTELETPENLAVGNRMHLFSSFSSGLADKLRSAIKHNLDP